MNEPPGLHLREWDISNQAGLLTGAREILTAYPALDTILINAGVQCCFSLLDPPTSTEESITSKIQVNLIAPVLVLGAFLPHYVVRTKEGQPGNLLVTSSALAFHAVPFYPTYCSTRPGIHAFIVTLREQLVFCSVIVEQNFSVIEVIPPYTDMEWDVAHRAGEGVHSDAASAVY